MRRVEDPDDIQQAIRRRRVIAAGLGDFNDDWLGRGDRVALAEETGRHVGDYEAGPLARALNSAGVTQLIAATNDPLLIEDEVYEFEASEKGFTEFSDTLAGINALVIPSTGDQLAILFTVDDFRLIAGPRAFIEAYAGDLLAAKQQFDEFAEGHMDEMKPVLRRAAAYMSWIEPGQ